MNSSFDAYAKLSDLATEEILDVSSDWDLIVRFLRGDLRTLLSTCDQLAVRILADGFGRIAIPTRENSAMLWDWSHVRDSSAEAVARMGAWLRAFVEVGRVVATPGARVRVFDGKFDAEVVRSFERRPDGRVPVLVERDDGAEAMPFSDELEILAAAVVE